MVTSNVYRLASSGDKELMQKNLVADPASRFLWQLPSAAAGSRADLGFDPRRGGQPRPNSGRAVLRH